MASNTRYSVLVDGTDIGFTRSTKATAVAEAQAQAKATRQGVEVVTATGTSVFSLPAAKQRVAYVHPKPDTRVISVDEALEALIEDGYVAAYRRATKGATVLRNEGAEDDSKFAVLLDSGEVAGYAPTTRGAGAIMTALPKVVAA